MACQPVMPVSKATLADDVKGKEKLKYSPTSIQYSHSLGLCKKWSVHRHVCVVFSLEQPML